VATLRRLTPGDIPQLHRLEAETYLPSLHESDEAFLKIIELFPEGAFGFFEGDELCAYAFAVPLPAGMVLELKSPLTELPPHADSLYIHDVAVGGRHRGRGLATRLVATLLALARAHGLPASELVSVQGSAPFWQRFGFQRIEEFEYAPGAPATKMRYESSRRPGP
jgi:ribosomal protein S18 acetylase RimI-like enzyme